MKLNLTIVLLLSTILLSAQGVLRYEGPFPNASNEEGTANYSYYKNAETGKNVKHGAFRYKVKIKNTDSRVYRNISGTYKSGWKDGLWEYAYTTKDKRESDGYYYSYSINLTANYESGWPDGVWYYTSSVKRRRNNIERGVVKWFPYEIMKDETMKLHFNHGVLVDSLWKKGLHKSFSLLSDEKGFLNGTFEFITDTSNVTVDYLEGFPVKTSKPDNNVEITTDHYRFYMKHKDDLNKNGAMLDTATLTFYSEVFYNTIYNDKFFNYRFIDGERMVSFKGKRKEMEVRFMGLYKRELKAFVSEDEQRIIQGVFAYQISVSRMLASCEKVYKSSDNDVNLRKKVAQLKSIEIMMKSYTCIMQVYKTVLMPKDIAKAAASCKSDIRLSSLNTRRQILDTVLSKAKALEAKASALKCK